VEFGCGEDFEPRTPHYPKWCAYQLQLIAPGLSEAITGSGAAISPQVARGDCQLARLALVGLSRSRPGRH